MKHAAAAAAVSPPGPYEPPLPLAEMLQCVSLSQDWVSVTQQHQPKKHHHSNSPRDF